MVKSLNVLRNHVYLYLNRRLETNRLQLKKHCKVNEVITEQQIIGLHTFESLVSSETSEK